MAVVSIGLGWIVAGRVLRPLQTMTATTRRISERSLHERLALDGPRDELTDLGDTIDELLGPPRNRVRRPNDASSPTPPTSCAPRSCSTQTLLQVALADPAITLDSLTAACGDVIDSGKDQAQLIDALLTLARSQRGLDHREPFDLATVATEALEDFDIAAAGKDLTLELTLGPAATVGDSRLARTLVQNLIDNAVRYNQPGGRLEVLTSTLTGGVVLKVTNTGPLIPDEQVDRLLQPFQRIDDQRSNNRGGLGLGLSIVAAIADAHHASLSVRPQPMGGLAIEVTFPGPSDHAVTQNV